MIDSTSPDHHPSQILDNLNIGIAGSCSRPADMQQKNEKAVATDVQQK
jgi:hypothetical protein